MIMIRICNKEMYLCTAGPGARWTFSCDL